MDNYYAVVKYTSNSPPLSTGMFQAPDTNTAIAIMCNKAKVQSTMNLNSYELMRVEGRNYTPVARKDGSDFPRPVYKGKPVLDTSKLPVPVAPKVAEVPASVIASLRQRTKFVVEKI